MFPGHLMSMTPEQLQAWRWEREIDERNRPLTDEELDAMFPEGYKVLCFYLAMCFCFCFILLVEHIDTKFSVLRVSLHV